MITAEKFLTGMFGKDQYPTGMDDCLIEFAKLHVQEALKHACENHELTNDSAFNVVIDKDSILNAYPLDNIK
jgi:hypothetical protein